jgi:anti-sigma-K factor RskA
VIGMKRGDIHDLAAAYVLDALDRDELKRFERHLAVCDRCAHEVRLLAQGTERLGGAAGLFPPPDMRERVMAAVRATPQDIAGELSGYPTPHGRSSSSTGSAGRVGRSRARARRTRSVRFAAGLAGFGLAASAVMGVFLYRMNAELDRQQAATRRVSQVLSAPDATATSSSDRAGKGITAVVSRTMGRAVITVHGLPSLSRGRVYQLWLTGTRPGSAVRSVGILAGGPAAGTAEPLIATGVDARSAAFAVTVEPAGGSPRPTTMPLAQLPLKKS